MSQALKRALIVRGGWKRRAPAKATGLIIAYLQRHGYVVAVSKDLDVYTRAALLESTDLVVQCWTPGLPSDDQAAGLRRAVEGGTGFVGWHGGILESFPAPPAYSQLIGAQFVPHPQDFDEYALVMAPGAGEHEIVRGLPAEVRVEAEQYWVLSDPYNDVLATTTIPAGDGEAWSRPVTVPAVWTRAWGAGRVFMCAPGHCATTLDVPEIRTLVERGLLWASR